MAQATGCELNTRIQHLVPVEGARKQNYKSRINKMFKKIIGIAAAVLMIAPVSALAAVSIDTLNGVTFNGKVSLAGVDAVQAGANIDVKVLVNSTGGADFNSVSADWIGDFLPPVCASFQEQTQSGAFFESVALPAPTTAGNQDLQVKLYGVNGAGQDFNCNPSNVVDTANFNGRVAVNDGTTLVSNTNSNNTGSGTLVIGSTAWITQQLGFLQLQFGCYVNHGTWTGSACTMTTPPSTTGNAAKCAALADHMIGAQMGVRNSANGVLQGFLIGEHMSIPLLQNNQATYGFWGDQTNGAVNSYKGQYGC